MLYILMLNLCLDQVCEGVNPRGTPAQLPPPPSVANTFKIFVPRTKDMNKGFLTFSDNDPHSTGNSKHLLRTLVMNINFIFFCYLYIFNLLDYLYLFFFFFIG